MKERSNDYFVKINPKFLFNTQGIFKSYFTPWVYLYLKLEKNMLISKQINNEFKINQKELVEFFMVDRATIYRAIKELINFGVLSKSGSKYRIFDEQAIINQRLGPNNANLENSTENIVDEKLQETEQAKVTSLDKLPEYIMIFQNVFLQFRADILNTDDNFKDYPRTVIKIMEMYYYLIACNKLCLIPEIDIQESEETQTSISKNLNHDNRLTRLMLGVLNKINYIEQNKDGTITTIKKKITGYFSQNNIGNNKENKPNRLTPVQDEGDLYGDNCKPVYEVASKGVQSKDVCETDDTFDFANSFSGNQDKLKEVSKKVESIESEDRVAEEVTNQERLGYMFSMCKGDVDKFINKASEGNIPEEEVYKWLQNNQAA